MRVALNPSVRREQGSPGFPVIGSFVSIRLHVAEGMAVKGRVSGGFVVTAGFDG